MQVGVRRPIDVRLPDFGAIVIESRHAPGFAPAQLRHDFAKFILVIGGRGTLRAARHRHTMSRDVLLHVPANVSHSIEDEPGEPVSLYALCYRPDRLTLSRDLARRGLVSWDLSVEAPHLVRLVRSDFREMLFEQQNSSPGWQTVILGRVGDMLVRATRMLDRTLRQKLPPIGDSDSARRVGAYAARLNSTFYREGDLDSAAAATGLSRRRFTELFRRVTGRTWRDQLQHHRLEHAKTLLAQTDKQVIAVAFECGFDDLSHFHRVFKQVERCTPLEYRRRRG